jgi:uncharacterized membrane protein YbhN (UPF0104 family)
MKRSATVLGWLAATALLVYFAGKIDRAELSAAMSMVKWTWIALALAANGLILVSWAGLWWSVAPDAERPPYRTMFGINAMASALMNTVPFLGGHAAAVVLMVKRAGLSRASALSVMALDQLGEGLAKVLIFLVVALAAPLPAWMRIGVATASAGVGGLLLALVIAAHAHERIKPRPGARLTWMARGRIVAAHWAERMETLRSVRRSFSALAFAVGTKVAEGAGLLAVQHAFGVDLSIGSTALVLAAVVLGSILPVAPGNVGTYEAAAIIAYRHLGIDPVLATILALASHICFMIPSVGIGYLLGSWKWLKISPSALETQEAAARPTA